MTEIRRITPQHLPPNRLKPPETKSLSPLENQRYTAIDADIQQSTCRATISIIAVLIFDSAYDDVPEKYATIHKCNIR
jgi:hypothetical protein